MIKRRRASEAVLVAVLDKEKVLLQVRKDTGWMDGWYDLPSGHIEYGESVVGAARRELWEEVGVKVGPEDLELFHISISDDGSNAPYTYFIFKTAKGQERPFLREPDRAEKLGFHALDDLPEKILPYVKVGLDNISKSGVTFSYLASED